MSGYIGEMRLSISQKLVIALLGLTVLVLVATLGLARWSFERGFLDYVNALEQTRLERLAADLAEQYRTDDQTWATMTPEKFEAALHRRAPAMPRYGAPPPPPDTRRLGPGTDDRRPPPPHGRPPGPPPKDTGPPTALFDSDGTQIVGAALDGTDEDHILVPIVIEEVVVGELRSLPRRQLDRVQETEFSRQQLHTSVLIGVVSLVLATILSLLLAKALLNPVRRMMTSVSKLSNGDYDVRIDEDRADEIGQLGKNIDRLAATLEENRTSRRRWLADISHELRTPLTILTGEIEALKEGVREFDTQQLHSLDREAQRLQHLIDDLYELSVSDVGGLRYQFERIDLCSCFATLIVSVRERAWKCGIEFVAKSDGELWVNADAKRMSQLFINLVENSLSYTNSPGRILFVLSRHGDSVQMSIEDTAPGVSAAECERLFEPLYRQDVSRSRRTAGAGLGLAICHNIVEAHSGVITASPSSMGGLQIRVEIPAVGAKK